MLNDLNRITLVAAAAFLLPACGEGETPAPSAGESAPAVAAPATPPAIETVPEETVTAAEPETVQEAVPEMAGPEPAPVTVPEEPVAPEQPAAEATAPPEPLVAEAPAIEEPAATASLDGGQLYNSYCAICHKAGLNAAPKFGSKPLWRRVVAKGRDTVYANAINGLRGMPPRGGFAQLTDDEVMAATDYMVRAGGGWGDN